MKTALYLLWGIIATILLLLCIILTFLPGWFYPARWLILQSCYGIYRVYLWFATKYDLGWCVVVKMENTPIFQQTKKG